MSSSVENSDNSKSNSKFPSGCLLVWKEEIIGERGSLLFSSSSSSTARRANAWTASAAESSSCPFTAVKEIVDSALFSTSFSSAVARGRTDEEGASTSIIVAPRNEIYQGLEFLNIHSSTNLRYIRSAYTLE